MKCKLQDTIPSKEPNSKEEFVSNLQALTEAISYMTNKIVPKSKPSLYVKRWWTQELTMLHAKTRQLG